MKKKYFVKYLPVDGEIKIGDMYIDDQNLIRESFTSDKSYWSSRLNYKKVKPFIFCGELKIGVISEPNVIENQKFNDNELNFEFLADTLLITKVKKSFVNKK